MDDTRMVWDLSVMVVTSGHGGLCAFCLFSLDSFVIIVPALDMWTQHRVY
jgi:hypothetical protein